MTTAQLSVVSYYVLHERYQLDPAHLSNDLAILRLVTAISINELIQFARLPPDNSNNFAGMTCTITGWGRTSSSNEMSVVLQQASISVIENSECVDRLNPITDRKIWYNNVCVFEQGKGTCNGDSGSPLNCPDGDGGYYVIGVVSWSVHVNDNTGQDICVKDYPSMYTRTAAYLDWINSN